MNSPTGPNWPKLASNINNSLNIDVIGGSNGFYVVSSNYLLWDTFLYLQVIIIIKATQVVHFHGC
jgi:hypothetical protein